MTPASQALEDHKKSKQNNKPDKYRKILITGFLFFDHEYGTLSVWTFFAKWESGDFIDVIGGIRADTDSKRKMIVKIFQGHASRCQRSLMEQQKTNNFSINRGTIA